MKIVRVCKGNTHVADLPITQEQLDRYMDGTGVLCQDAFPHLAPEQREFIISGITPWEWNRIFGTDAGHYCTVCLAGGMRKCGHNSLRHTD
jgi:hypothetical protein